MRFETSDKRRQAVKQSDFRMTVGGCSVYLLNRGELSAGEISRLCFASLEMTGRREIFWGGRDSRNG